MFAPKKNHYAHRLPEINFALVCLWYARAAGGVRSRDYQIWVDLLIHGALLLKKLNGYLNIMMLILTL